MLRSGEEFELAEDIFLEWNSFLMATIGTAFETWRAGFSGRRVRCGERRLRLRGER
jgi:hypothetical protein